MDFTALKTEIGRLDRTGEKELEFLETPDALGRITRILAGVFIIGSSIIFLRSNPVLASRPFLNTLLFIGFLILSVARRTILGDAYQRARPIPRGVAYALLGVIALLMLPWTMRSWFGVEQRLVVISNMLIAINAVNFMTRMRYSEYRGLFVSAVF